MLTDNFNSRITLPFVAFCTRLFIKIFHCLVFSASSDVTQHSYLSSDFEPAPQCQEPSCYRLPVPEQGAEHLTGSGVAKLDTLPKTRRNSQQIWGVLHWWRVSVQLSVSVLLTNSDRRRRGGAGSNEAGEGGVAPSRICRAVQGSQLSVHQLCFGECRV